jgi:purine-binding chemotaxis protein CheW
VQALLVPLHADLYALELTAVREVLPLPALTPLPGAPASLLGVFNLRGEIVPLFDTARLLGLAEGAPGDQIVVADGTGEAVGLLTHGRPWREELGEPAGAGALPAARGRFAVARGVATLLDLDGLLRGEAP